jgi:ribonuclease J
MVSITAYGGAGVIGGNKILLENGDARLFLDFGTDYHTRSLYFREFLDPRASQGLLDPLTTGLLPPLEGLYRSDLALDPRLWERFRGSPLYRRFEDIDGVLVSHAHLDHCGAISFLRTEIPIYTSAMTAVIAKAVQDCGGTTLEGEFVYATQRAPEKGVLTTTPSGVPYKARPYVFCDLPAVPDAVAEFWTRKPLKERDLISLATASPEPAIGGHAVRAFPVDHSVYGASAWAVQTTVGWVVYTGDLRAHGRQAAASAAFVRAAAALKPLALICEGTRLPDIEDPRPRPSVGRPVGPVSEDTVRQRALAEVKGQRGLVIADFSARHIERLQSFLTVARECGRRLVVLAKDAYLLEAMHRLDPSIPTVASTPELFLWEDPRLRLSRWQEELQTTLTGRLVRASEVRGREDEYILCWSLWDLPRLIDLRPTEGKFIYSSTEVYDEEGAADVYRLENWATLFGMSTVGLPREVAPRRWEIPPTEQGLHASGHASGADLLALVRDVNPNTLIPVHTERPDLFEEALAGSGIEVRIPTLGEPIVLG